MKLTFYENENTSPLVEEYYQFICEEDYIPYQTSVLPIGCSNISYVHSLGNKAIIDNEEISLYQLTITGIFNKSYKLIFNEIGLTFGITFHPTALHKILSLDLSKIENKHLTLQDVNFDFCNKLNTIFKSYKTPKKIINEVENLLKNTPLHISHNTILMDKAIHLIRKKEGLINIEALLLELKISQKTLETQFKKIIGITPGKYIRLYRFFKLMKRYTNREMDIKDLIYMYDYYDSSHFNKDFKFFMNETPSSFFKKDNEFIMNLLKNKKKQVLR